jgi:hypothetical protein
MAQVTSTSQLSDVQPTDWAFVALQSLVERYGCIAGYPEGTYRGNRRMTRLGVDGDEENEVELDDTYYYFLLGDRVRVTLVATETELTDIVDPLSPVESSGSGAISRFGRHNPIYRESSGAGFGVNYLLSDRASFSLAYLASDAEDPEGKEGLFNGNYGALAQLTFAPMQNLDLGLTYIHAYYNEDGGVNLTGNTGSTNARRPFGNVATSADSLGLEATWRISPKFIISGWAGYEFARSEISDDEADIFNYAVILALPDLGGKGNLAAFVFGMPPKVIDSTQVEDDHTSLHIEAFYRLQLTDNIAITPGIFLVTNPEHNDNNDTIYVGAIRTTFNF